MSSRFLLIESISSLFFLSFVECAIVATPYYSNSFCAPVALGDPKWGQNVGHQYPYSQDRTRSGVMDLDGSGQYFDLVTNGLKLTKPNGKNLFDESFTVDIGFRLRSENTWCRIFNTGYGTSATPLTPSVSFADHEIAIDIYGSTNQLIAQCAPTFAFGNPGTADNGKWVRTTASWDNDRYLLKFYENGALTNSNYYSGSTQRSTDYHRNLAFLGRSIYPDAPTNGEFDYVAIYDGVYDPTQLLFGQPGQPSADVCPPPFPGQPTITSVSLTGAGRVTVSFSVPSTVPILQCVARVSTNGFLSASNDHADPIVFLNLPQGNTYTFVVYCSTISGNGPTSNPSDPFTVLGVPPVAPTIGLITQSTSAHAVIPITIPLNVGGSPITSCRVTSQPDNIFQNYVASTTLSFNPGSSVQLPFLNTLGLGSSYTFTVFCSNQYGLSPVSAVSSNSIVVLPVISSISLINSISGPATMMLAYDITSSSTIAPSCSLVSTPAGLSYTLPVATSLQIPLTSLHSYTSYVFVINCNVGTSTAPRLVSSVSSDPFFVPGPPIITGIETSIVSATTTSLSYTVNSEGIPMNGCAYLLTYKKSKTQYISIPASSSSSSLTIILSSLSPGTAYTLTLQCSNQFGSNFASATFTQCFPLTSAPILSIVQGAVGSNKVFANVSVPVTSVSTNACPITCTVRFVTGTAAASAHGAIDYTSGVAPIPISGIVPDRSYTFQATCSGANSNTTPQSNSVTFAYLPQPVFSLNFNAVNPAVYNLESSNYYTNAQGIPITTGVLACNPASDLFSSPLPLDLISLSNGSLGLNDWTDFTIDWEMFYQANQVQQLKVYEFTGSCGTGRGLFFAYYDPISSAYPTGEVASLQATCGSNIESSIVETALRSVENSVARFTASYSSGKEIAMYVNGQRIDLHQTPSDLMGGVPVGIGGSWPAIAPTSFRLGTTCSHALVLTSFNFYKQALTDQQVAASNVEAPWVSQPVITSVVPGSSRSFQFIITFTFSMPSISLISKCIATSDPPSIQTATSQPILNGSTTAITTGGVGVITISNVIASIPYTFHVTCYNSNGVYATSLSSSPLIYYSPPYQPIMGTANQMYPSQTLNVSFTANKNNGGSPVTSCTGVTTPATVPVTVSYTTTDLLSIQFVNLNIGTTYQISVVCTNSLGPSESSLLSNSVLIAASPSLPVIITLTAGAPTSASAVVAFQISDNYSPISLCSAYCISTLSFGFTNVLPCGTLQNSSSSLSTGAGAVTSLSMTVTNLFANVRTGVLLQCYNAAGVSYNSNILPSNMVIAADSTPRSATISCISLGGCTLTSKPTARVVGAPWPPLFTPSASSTTVLLLQMQASNDGGSRVTKCTVSVQTGIHPAVSQSRTTGFSGFNVSFDNLTPNATYTITAFCINEYGQGQSSTAMVQMIVPPQFPMTPMSVTLGAPKSGTAFIYFSPPSSNGGSTITSCTATSVPDNVQGSTYGAAISPIKVTGLTAGVTYAFQISCTNHAGVGASTYVSAVVPSASVYSSGVYKVTPLGVPLVPSVTAAVLRASIDSPYVHVTVAIDPNMGGGTVTDCSVINVNTGAIVSTSVTEKKSVNTLSGVTIHTYTAVNPTFDLTLANGIQYRFNATCKNEHGWSSLSLPSNQVILQLRPPQVFACLDYAVATLGTSNSYDYPGGPYAWQDYYEVYYVRNINNCLSRSKLNPYNVTIPIQIPPAASTPTYAPILYCNATATVGGSPGPIGSTLATALSPMFVSGLTPGVPFTLSVTCTNSVGTSDPNPGWPTMLYPPGAPVAPKITVVQQTGDKAVVTIYPKTYPSSVFDGVNALNAFNGMAYIPVSEEDTDSNWPVYDRNHGDADILYVFPLSDIARNYLAGNPSFCAVFASEPEWSSDAVMETADQLLQRVTLPLDRTSYDLFGPSGTSTVGPYLSYGSSFSFTFTDLKPGQTYTFSTYCSNDFQTYDTPEFFGTSASIEIETNPGAPTSVAAVSVNVSDIHVFKYSNGVVVPAGGIGVQFITPTFTGYGPLVSCSATAQPGGMTKTTTSATFQPAGSNMIVFTGLTPWVQYRFSAACSNELYAGPSSALSESVMIYGPPLLSNLVIDLWLMSSQYASIPYGGGSTQLQVTFDIITTTTSCSICVKDNNYCISTTGSPTYIDGFNVYTWLPVLTFVLTCTNEFGTSSLSASYTPSNQLNYGYPATSVYWLAQGQYLLPGQWIQSADGNFFAIQQADGNFCVYSCAQTNYCGLSAWSTSQSQIWCDGNLPGPNTPTQFIFTTVTVYGNIIKYASPTPPGLNTLQGVPSGAVPLWTSTPPYFDAQTRLYSFLNLDSLGELSHWLGGAPLNYYSRIWTTGRQTPTVTNSDYVVSMQCQGQSSRTLCDHGLYLPFPPIDEFSRRVSDRASLGLLWGTDAGPLRVLTDNSNTVLGTCPDAQFTTRSSGAFTWEGDTCCCSLSITYNPRPRGFAGSGCGYTAGGCLLQIFGL